MFGLKIAKKGKNKRTYKALNGIWLHENARKIEEDTHICQLYPCFSETKLQTKGGYCLSIRGSLTILDDISILVHTQDFFFGGGVIR